MTDSAALQLLIDREAIRELTARYARLVHEGDGRGVGALYTEDGRFKAGIAYVTGRSNLQDFLEKQLTPGKSTPLVTNYIIEINGAEATSYCSMHTPWYRHDYPGFCGDYRDTYRKVDGQWYFVERDFTFHEGRPADS
jgi:hypothetical protein